MWSGRRRLSTSCRITFDFGLGLKFKFHSNMLNYLKELLNQNPFVTAIELASKGIVAIDSQSLAVLSRFTELRKIDLSDNYIKRLPSDLSGLRLITDFDLNGNPIEDV